MKYNKISLFVAAILFTIVGYSQKDLQSSYQKKCSWNNKSQTYQNCFQQEKSYKIEINNSKKLITISCQKEIYSYYIQSKKMVRGKTIFQTTAATGIGSIITLNLSKKILEITTKPSSVKRIFYLNE